MRIENRTWKLTIRVLWAALVIALLAGFVVNALTGSSAVIEVVRDLGVASLIGFLFLKLSGWPAVQPYLEFRKDGLSYGKKQVILWENVSSIELVNGRRGKELLVIRTSDWKPSGVFARSLARSPLPLSVFDTRKDLHEWLAVLRRYAPSLRVPTL